MDDIVTRLRRAAVGLPQDEMNQQAADEIERLRAVVRYAAHDDGCEQPWHGIQCVCTCGLSDFLEADRG